MENLILDNILLILFLPLWIFLIIMCGRFFAVFVNKIVIYFLTLFSSFLGAGMCALSLLNMKESVNWLYPFIKINELTINCGIRVDKLSLIIALILFVISFAVQLFSISYLKEEKKSYRFFAFLNLFNFSMAFLLFSPNLFQFYVFWELVSVISYLLIGFEYKREDKSIASNRVFLINRFGDTALVGGIILISFYMFSYVENYSLVALSFEDFNAISTLLMAHTTPFIFYLICGLFILAAAVKSAQFPFYTWLQDAMEAKLPVSALLHSATMVVAGVYLIIKMLPFFTLNPVLMTAISVIGIFTALVCSILASIETHPKKVLAYSTSANLGLMFFAIGLGNLYAGLILLVAHAFIKSTLFLLLPDEKTKKIGYSRFVLFCISALSLAGILFAGIAPKELIFPNLAQFFAIIYLIVSFMTAFYITRLTIIIYKNNELINTCNIIKVCSFVILFCGNISLYFLMRKHYTIAEPYAAAVGGIAFAMLLGKKNLLEQLNQTPKILENIYNKIFPYLYQQLALGLNYTDNKILANYKPILFLSKIPVILANWIEVNLMNKTVTKVADVLKEISRRDMIIQSGNVQNYNSYAFIIISIIIALVITGYSIAFLKLTICWDKIMFAIILIILLLIIEKVYKLQKKDKREE